MAIIDKKQKRWYSKSTFDSLDKTTIPVGTEIQVAGELGQADFDSDTNTKLNAVPNKLDKPSGNPTGDSLVKVSSTGSVEYVTYKRYYKHSIYFSPNGGTSISLTIYATLSESTKINTLALVYSHSNILSGSNVTVDDPENSKYYSGVLHGMDHVDSNYGLTIYANGTIWEYVDITNYTVSDTVTEL